MSAISLPYGKDIKRPEKSFEHVCWNETTIQVAEQNFIQGRDMGTRNRSNEYNRRAPNRVEQKGMEWNERNGMEQNGTEQNGHLTLDT